MTVTFEHHKAAEVLYKEDRSTREVKERLMGKGLTKSQANAACRTARKHLGIYVSDRKKRKAEAKRAMAEARILAEQEERNRMHREAAEAKA